MSATDRGFLLSLAAVLVLMAVLVLRPQAPSAASGAAPGVEGEARDVDLDALRRRLVRGELSDREAMYYHLDGEDR